MIKPDLEKEKQALLNRHIQDRNAHFQKDVESLLSGMAAKQINVRDGRVIERLLSEAEKGFTAYFNQVDEFIHWDDLQPPIIQISKDGSMGWMINQIRLHYRSADDEETDSTCAWLMVYEKREGNWVAVANASTFSPQ